MSVDHAQLDRDHLWHPFTQQQAWCEEEPLVIERGEGCYLFDAEGHLVRTMSSIPPELPDRWPYPEYWVAKGSDLALPTTAGTELRFP